MTDSTSSSDALHFDATPSAGPAGAMACAECAGPIHAYYYEAGGRVLCARCKQALETVRGSFGRALLFGFGGAIAGAIFYYAFTKITGVEWGLIAALLGFGVGYAVHVGGGKVGGRRYQVAAVLLTYLSLGMAYMPFAMDGFNEGAKGRKAHQAAVADSLQAARESGNGAAARVLALRADSLGADTSVAAAIDEAAAAKGPAAPKADAGGSSLGGIALGIGALLLGALALPVIVVFGSLPGGLITAVIIFFGMRRAWQMNAGTSQRAGTVTGPYKVGTAR